MRTFLILWTGHLVSMVGASMTSFALSVWVWEATHSATWFALMVTAGAVAKLATFAVAGGVVDRSDRRAVLFTTTVGLMATTLALWALWSAEMLAVWHVALLVAVAGSLSVFQLLALQTSIVLLVEPEQLGRAAGIARLPIAVSQIAGPAAAGVLMVTAGMGAILVIDAVTYGVALFCILMVIIPRPKPRAVDASAAAGGSQVSAWAYLKARPGLVYLMALLSVVSLLASGGAVLIAPTILSIASASTLGMVNAVGGVGMVLGGISLGIWGGPARRMTGVLIFGAIASLGISLYGVANSPMLLAGAALLTMFATPVFQGCSEIIWVSKVDADVQGRVFALREMFVAGAMVIGSASAGPIAELGIGQLVEGGGKSHEALALTMVVLGLASVAAFALGALLPRLRRLEDEVPSVVGPGHPAAAGQPAPKDEPAAVDKATPQARKPAPAPMVSDGGGLPGTPALSKESV